MKGWGCPVADSGEGPGARPPPPPLLSKENCHFGLKKAQKGDQMHFITHYEEVEKTFCCVIYLCLKDSAFTRYVKGVPFVNRRYTKEAPCLCQK